MACDPNTLQFASLVVFETTVLDDVNVDTRAKISRQQHRCIFAAPNR
jgi:hypothetical protein